MLRASCHPHPTLPATAEQSVITYNHQPARPSCFKQLLTFISSIQYPSTVPHTHSSRQDIYAKTNHHTDTAHPTRQHRPKRESAPCQKQPSHSSEREERSQTHLRITARVCVKAQPRLQDHSSVTAQGSHPPSSPDWLFHPASHFLDAFQSSIEITPSSAFVA
jgi:hypothetical protein